MRSIRHAALAAITACAAFASPVHAQTIYSEQDKLIRADRTVGTLGADLFGDKVNFYNGTIEFTQTDVSLPGNNALPVSVGRRLVPGSEVRVPGLFADWDLDIPHLHGIFASGGQAVYGLGWSAQLGGGRCTNYSPPPNVNYQGAMWTGDEFWHGSFMYLPGSGSQEILSRAGTTNANVPSGGDPNPNPWPLATKSMAAIRCIAAQQGGGEGFLAVTPDGTQYRFDWVVSRTYPGLSKPSPLGEALRASKAGKTAQPSATIGVPVDPQPNVMFGYNVPRQEVWILPTRVTDRYGNYVDYIYNPAMPWQLQSITSSDGRTITLTYAPGTNIVTSIFDGTRTWTYTYGSDAAGATLTAVTQPDNATWQFQMGALTRALPLTTGYSTCDAGASIGAGLETGSMTHPSGAVGTFQTYGTMHARSFVQRECRGDDNDGGGYPVYPRLIPSRSLVKKTISNPSLPTTEWNYTYSAPVESWSTCTGNCPETKSTDVTDSRGVLTRYTFGNRFRVTEGQLQKVEVGTLANGFLRTTTTHYRAPDAGPYPSFAGISPQRRGNGELASRYTPEDQRVITQQGVNFSWTGSGFDIKARPTVVSRVSSMGSRTETTAFYDHAAKWVLGQTASVTESGTGLVPVLNTFDNTTANLLTTTKFGLPGQGPDQTFTYNGDGTLATRKDGLNRITSFSNYMRGLARYASYADGTSESATIENRGLITSVTDANGFTTSYEYDLIGRLNRIIRPTGDPVAWNDTTLTFEQVPYGDLGLPIGHWRQTVATGNARTIIYFDAMWRPRLTRTFDTANEGATAKTVLRNFDMDGRSVFESYPARAIGSVNATPVGSATLYDALGRSITSYADSELGLLTSSTDYLPGFLQRSTNARGFATVTGYQAFDQPSTSGIASISAPEGVSVNIARDVFGKPTSITRGGGGLSVTRSYVYDANQRLCKTVEPEIGATIQAYDAANNTLWRATGLGLTSTASCDQTSVPGNKITAFAYDLRNRLTGTGFGDGSPAIGRSYTPDGLPLTVVSNGSTWVYGYNRRRLLTSEALTYGSTYSITRAYDANGHPSALTYPDTNTIAYGPNALGEATQVGGYASNVSYHPNGAVAGYTLGGIAHSLTQNVRGLPAVNSATGVMQDQYSFDANGNVTAIADQQEGIASRTMPLYDGLDRLRVANSPGVWGNASYTYDALDNIRTSVVGVRSSVHNYDANNRLDTLNTNGTYTGYVYDSQGNITGRGTQGYYFDQGNRLQLANGVTGGTASYTYDGWGRRTTMADANGSSVQVYDRGGHLLYGTQQGSTSSTTRYVYLAGKAIAKTHSVTGTTWLFTDALGSPVASVGNINATLSFTCPSGWTLSGNTCTQSGTSTVAATVTGYTCPSGYTLSGSTCTLTTPTSSNASVSYSCPAGWTLSGSTCSSTSSSPATPVYSCPAGYTLSGTTCTGPSSYAATGTWSCNGYGSLQAYANSPSGYKCIVQSILTSDYESPYAQCQSIAASMGLPLVAAPLRNNGKFMDCTMGPVTVYSCPSGGTLSGSTCNTSVTQAAGVSGYSCASGTLSGSSCITGSSQAATATYSCPAGQTLSGTTCNGSSTSSTPGTPVYGCASGYTLSGTTCTSQTTNTTAATAGYSCPSGGTVSGNTCTGALWRTRYEPYGNTAAGVVPTDLGFTGHVNDAGSGLVYMQQRYYDPVAGRFLSVDPIVTDADTGAGFNLYEYAKSNPYRYTDPDGRVERVIDETNLGRAAPEVAPRGMDGGPVRMSIQGARADLQAAREANGLSQNAATREAKREAGIPTSQQSVSQTNGKVTDPKTGEQVSVGRQQTYEVPKSGGGAEKMSVQVSRDTRGAHKDMPQIEAGKVKSGGQTDAAGRPRIQNEGKVRVDFSPKKD